MEEKKNDEGERDKSIILKSFASVGIFQFSILDEYEANKALDQIYQKYINSEQKKQQFNRAAAKEIFEQTLKNKDKKVHLEAYISTILNAHKQLKKYFIEYQKYIKDETDAYKKAELTSVLHQYKEDYELLTKPFGLYLKQPKIQNPMREMFEKVPRDNNESSPLKIIFMITLACFVLEFFLMFQKHHFLNMLTYVAILSIFLLEYFDRPFIQLTLYCLGVSIIFDFFWVALQADNYWNIDGASQHPSSQQGFFRFIYIMTYICIIAKAAIAYLLFQYNINRTETCQNITLFGFRLRFYAKTGNPPLPKFQEQKQQKKVAK